MSSPLATLRAEWSGAPNAVRIAAAVCACAFVALVLLVALRTTGFWYDEVWYLASVAALSQLGLTTEFLRGLPGPAGPLYAVVHRILAPVTGLEPLPTRLATIGLFALVIVAQSFLLRDRHVAFPKLRSMQLVAAPMLYGVVGTALTEIPAMLAFTVHVALLFAALRRSDAGGASALAYALGSGLFCGLAVTGRQTYLVALLALPVLAWRRPRAIPVLVACALSALMLPASLFGVWGGLTPPRTAFVGHGLSIANALKAFAYAGIVYCIYDVSWLRQRAPLNLALFATGIALNFAFGLLEHTPLLNTARLLLPAWALELYTRGLSGAMLGLGLVFIGQLAMLLRGGDNAELYLVVATGLMLAAAIKVTHNFAGRYIVGCLPLLVVVALTRAPDTTWKAVRMALGSAVGLVSLTSYLRT